MNKVSVLPILIRTSCCILFLNLGTILIGIGQVDTLLRADSDSTSRAKIDSIMLSNRLDSVMKAGLNGSLTQVDSQKNGKKPLKERIEKAKDDIGEHIPKLYTEGEKLKFKISLPWRDPFILPVPRAFKRTGPRPPYDPEVAWQRSMIIPGWGQLYNKSYWKIPFFYAGYGAAIWWIDLNQKQYLRYREAYFKKLDDIDTPGITGDADGIRNQRNNFRRLRDYGYVALAGWHLLHVVEAYIHAHLKGFDVSEDLSMQMRPGIIQSPVLARPNSLAPGASLSFTF